MSTIPKPASVPPPPSADKGPLVIETDPLDQAHVMFLEAVSELRYVKANNWGIETERQVRRELLEARARLIQMGGAHLIKDFEPTPVDTRPAPTDPATETVTRCQQQLQALSAQYKKAQAENDGDAMARVNARLGPAEEQLKLALKVQATLAKYGTGETQPDANRFPLLSFEDMLSRPPLTWLVKGVLPAEGIAAIYGPPGSGKSFLLFDMLAAIARGARWFNHRTRQAPVLYVALEGAAGFQQRAAAYAKRFHIKPAMQFITSPLNLHEPQDLAALVAAIRAAGWQGGGVIAVDTLNAAMPGKDENSPEDMGASITALKAIQAAFGGVVIVVHHTGKDATKGLRGHSSLLGALDAAIEVAREPLATVRQWSTAKLKDGADGEGPAFTLESVSLGTDEDGDPLSSCVIAGGAHVAEAVQIKKDNKLSQRQREALARLREIFAAAPMLPDTKAPPGVKAVSAEVAMAGIEGILTVKKNGTKPAAMIEALRDLGHLKFEDGWVWLV